MSAFTMSTRSIKKYTNNMKRLLFPAWLIAALLSASVPSFADTVEQSIQHEFEAMASAETEEAFVAAARNIIALGGDAVPELTKRLAAATTDDERIEISYVLASIVGQAKFKREALALPPALPALVGKLLLQTRDMQLEANLANLSGFIAPHPKELGPGLLALLERAEDEALRATTSAAIAYQGKEVLPLVQNAFYGNANDRFSGDLARILYDTELNEQSIAKLQELVKSDDDDARQSAARTLDRAGVKSDALLDAALKDLASARTDVELSLAASRVKKHTDGSERVAIALAGALERAHRIEERGALVVALLATGEPGERAFFDALQASNDPEEIQDLMRLTNNSLAGDPRRPAAYIAILNRTDDEKVSEAAIHALVMTRESGRTAIKAALKKAPADSRLHSRLTTAASLFRSNKAAD